MKNREKINNMALYDFLKIISDRADKKDICVMELLPNGRNLCPLDSDCDKCLQKWLNEEVET